MAESWMHRKLNSSMVQSLQKIYRIFKYLSACTVAACGGSAPNRDFFGQMIYWVYIVMSVISGLCPNSVLSCSLNLWYFFLERTKY